MKECNAAIHALLCYNKSWMFRWMYNSHLCVQLNLIGMGVMQLCTHLTIKSDSDGCNCSAVMHSAMVAGWR